MTKTTDEKSPTPASQSPGQEAKNFAEAKRTEAETAKIEAEIEKLWREQEFVIAQTRGASALADVAEVEAKITLRREANILTADTFHHTYRLVDAITDKSVRACISQFDQWTRAEAEPVTIEQLIDSPGGSIFDGFHLVDYINWLHSEGHTVNTTAFGMAASMAGVLLQAGKERRMGTNAFALIHEAQFSAYGSFGNVEDEVKLVEMMHDRILTLFAERSKACDPKQPLTKKQIETKWKRRDWWLSSEQCLLHGFVDKVI